jgi:hypothetical protein
MAMDGRNTLAALLDIHGICIFPSSANAEVKVETFTCGVTLSKVSVVQRP